MEGPVKGMLGKMKSERGKVKGKRKAENGKMKGERKGKRKRADSKMSPKCKLEEK
jgi:hypothetical protein